MTAALRAVGGGLLVALALPPWGWWPLAIVGIALFETALGEHPTRRERAARGALFGLGWMAPGLAWMWFLTIPGYVVAVAMYAGLHALAAVVAPTGRWRVVGRPAAHLLVEAVRFVVPFGGVPLASIAIGQAGGPLLGVARVGGALLLTWLAFQIGFALAGPSPREGGKETFPPSDIPPSQDLARTGRAGTLLGRTTSPRALALLACVAVVLLAAVAPDGVSGGATLRIAAVQGGGPQGTSAIDTDERIVVERHLEATRTIDPGSADLVVWPENTVDVEPSLEGSEELELIAAEARRLGVPILVGVTDEAPGNRFANAQAVITPDGEVVDRYVKVRRVPFGEYMPLRGLLDAIGAPTDLVPRDAVAGDGPATLDVPLASGEQLRLAVAISWEVFFSGRVDDGVDRGGEVLINPTNGSSYTWTILQTQQVASSRLRAVEQGRWVVQAAPTGFSAFISPSGEVLDRTSVSEQEVVTRAVSRSTGRTWYARLGDVPIVLAGLAVLAVAWWRSGELAVIVGRLRGRSRRPG